jgi:tRNA modification GTPase
MIKTDTIVAVATPQGMGALGVIRLSGAASFSICEKVFRGKSLSQQASHTVHYGYIYEKEELIDEVMVSIFKAPKSFTTEDVIEISCHGSTYIVQRILQVLLNHGARLADAGEFTMRAFLHGRIDLAQAEAVADLIASESAIQHSIALDQMRGGFSTQLKALREELIDFAALIELELDFSEEDVEFANRDDLKILVQKIKTKVEELLSSFKLGNAIKNGIPVAIVGKPNAGKSTLLNTLLNDERAIVSEIAGTTRDTIEEILTIEGIQFRLIDTAGIRTTTDTIEAIGVAKALEKIGQASILVYLFDINDTIVEEVQEAVKSYLREGLKVILCPTKIDLHNAKDWEQWLTDLRPLADAVIGISAKEATNITLLKQEMLATVAHINTQQAIVTNARHYESLLRANQSLDEILMGIENQLTQELISLDLRTALSHLASITGAVDNDDVLASIFGKFCIGK